MREGQESVKLSGLDKIVVYALVQLGFQHKRIAALFDVNQGRVPEACAEIEKIIGDGQ